MGQVATLRRPTTEEVPRTTPKVVLVGPSKRFLSGISYYTYALARALADQCDLSVLLIRRLMPPRLYPGGRRVGDDLTEITLPQQISSFDGLDYFWGPSAIQAVKFLKKERPDVLVLQWWTGVVLHSFLLLSFFARRNNAKVVIEFHESLDTAEQNYRLLAAYVRLVAPRLFRNCAAFVVHSESDRELVSRTYGIEPSRITVIPHAVYDHQLKEDVASREQTDVCNLLFFGLIRPVKGLDLLVEAVNLLEEDEAKNYRLTIVGETWENCDYMVEAARKSRYSDRIEIVNRYVTDEDADRYFRDADVVVLPYRTSSQSGVLHMAMGYGLPVIAANVGGLGEAAAKYDGATLVAPNSSEALLEGIRQAETMRHETFSFGHRWSDSAIAYRDLCTKVGAEDQAAFSLSEMDKADFASIDHNLESQRSNHGVAALRQFLKTSFFRWWAVLTIGAILGTTLIGITYDHAIVSGNPSYVMFWIGILVFMAPTVAFIVRKASRRGGFIAVLVASGLFLYVPKILRNPFGPLYHDEFAHWAQVGAIETQGHLFISNTTIPIIQFFPGLHIVTATVQELTGLSIWSTAMTLLAIFHVIDLLAVFLIVEGFTRSSRTAAVAALIYSLNSSFMYFDTQYAYESLGVMLFLLSILAVQYIERSNDKRSRIGWSVVGFATGAMCAVTHHLSTVCLCLVLATWSIVTLRKWRKDHLSAPSSPAVAITAACIVGFFVAWVAFIAPGTVSYLDPYVKGSTSELVKLFGGGGGRSLFGGGGATATSVANPAYEEILAFLSPVMVFGAVVVTLRRLYLRNKNGQRRTAFKKWRHRDSWITLSLFGLIYFPSIPFILAPLGAEGARRTWAFTYLGIAVMLSPTIVRWLRRSREMSTAKGRRVRALLACGFVFALVGNVAAGLDSSYRFPGPYEVGSDTRSQTPELAALSHWFPATVGSNNKVVSDRLTGLELGAVGHQLLDAPSPGFPTYELWLDHTVPSPFLIQELSSSNYRYLVIDKQMDLPVSQAANFFSTQASSSDGTKVITKKDLARFSNYGWLSLVYSSTDFDVYRFQFSSLSLTGVKS